MSEGFTHAEEAIAPPSVMKRFLTSCDWLRALSTEVLGSRPMRAVPISWMAKPGGSLSSIGLNVAGAGGGEHFGGMIGHVATKRQFIFSPGRMNFQDRNPPGVAFFLIEFDEIVVVGQALAESVERKLPWAGLAERFFEFGAEADCPIPRAHPSRKPRP